MNRLKQIWSWFFPKWKVIEVLQGDWTERNTTVEIAVYEILYSSSRKKYKLKLSGFWPKKHPMYSVAIKKLNEYESNRTNTTNS